MWTTKSPAVASGAVVLFAIAAAGCSDDASNSSTRGAATADSTSPSGDVVTESNGRAQQPDSAGPSDSRMIGFRDRKDLFESLPSDAVSIEESDGQKAMRWDIAYVKNQHRACTKDVKAGITSGATLMRFKVRSSGNGDLWVQVNEASGEGYYQVISVGAEWKAISLKLADLKLNEDKVENRQLDVGQIAKLLVVDAAGLGGKTGKRTVWFADWEFVANESVSADDGLRAPSKQNDVGGSTGLIAQRTAEKSEAPPTFDSIQLQAKVDSVLPTEDEERWLRIGWQPNLMLARQQSQRIGKPMLIWIMDGNVLGCT